MQILIVEDETAAYENLVDILERIDPGIQIAGYTESIRQTIQWLKGNHAPDLILMDIHLSDGSAFSLFDSIKVDTPVIFTTAYDEYAIEAFKVNSIDYLLKPIKEEDIERAIEKFRRLTKHDLTRYIAQVAQLKQPSKYKDKILVPFRDTLRPVDLKEISYFYTTEKSTRIYLKNGKSLPYSSSLEQIESTLDPAEFIRANKQFIISRSSVKNITIWFDSRLLITLDVESPERIYVSKNRAAKFKLWMVSDYK